MAARLIPLPCERLETGMYVAELDRSWLHTPFAGPGLLLSSPQQLETLRQLCHYVYVDPERSDPELQAEPDAITGRLRELSADPGEYAPARRVQRNALQRVASLVQDARRFGRIELAPLRRVTDGLVQEVLQHPDAALWVVRMDIGGSLLYRRSLGTAIVSILLGRQLGFDADELRHLALGGLLLDIGKTSVPVPILAKPQRLNAAERLFVNRHVHQAGAMLRQNSNVPERVMEMVLGHHERLDGSGYPRRLRGTDIPLFARIAGIVDTFDALSVNRRYASAISGHAALRHLNSQRDRRFDGALVGELIHALGVYPTGTRVALVDRREGVVCAQNPDWPLRPIVLVTCDSRGQALSPPRLLTNGVDGHIARALPPETAALNPGPLEQAIASAR